MSTFQKPLGDEGILDLREIVDTLWARKLSIVVVVAIFSGLFVAAAFLITPVYRASTVVVPAGGDQSSLSGALGPLLSSVGGLASLTGLSLGGGGSQVEETLAVLRSRQFTEAFILDRNLMPLLFSGEWDSQRRDWKPQRRPPSLAQGYKYFDEEVRSITQDARTGLIRVQIDWTDREQAAAWANEMVARLNTEMRGRALMQAEAAVQYLETELETTSLVGTREAIGRLIEAQINQRMLANVTKEYALRVVDSAMVPDESDPIRPNKLLLFLAGPFIGCIIGALAVWLFGRRSGRSPDAEAAGKSV